MTETGDELAKPTTYTLTKPNPITYIMGDSDLLHTNNADNYITLARHELPPRLK